MYVFVCACVFVYLPSRIADGHEEVEEAAYIQC